jgi:hypothetical protein
MGKMACLIPTITGYPSWFKGRIRQNQSTISQAMKNPPPESTWIRVTVARPSKFPQRRLWIFNPSG